MIDFEKELDKFDFFKVDEDFIKVQDDMSVTIEAFNGVLKRLSKEQNKTNIQMEEILSILDERNENENIITDLKDKLASLEFEKTALVDGYIAILDKIEDLYRYSLQNDDAARSKQFSLLWSALGASASLLGITRIDDIHCLFDPRLNSAAGTKSLEDIGDGIILEVLKSGYLYKSVLLRKSEVIVNVSGKKGEGNE